jgi:hypothetical protein
VLAVPKARDDVDPRKAAQDFVFHGLGADPAEDDLAIRIAGFEGLGRQECERQQVRHAG